MNDTRTHDSQVSTALSEDPHRVSIIQQILSCTVHQRIPGDVQYEEDDESLAPSRLAEQKSSFTTVSYLDHSIR